MTSHNTREGGKEDLRDREDAVHCPDSTLPRMQSRHSAQLAQRTRRADLLQVAHRNMSLSPDGLGQVHPTSSYEKRPLSNAKEREVWNMAISSPANEWSLLARFTKGERH